MARSFYRPKAAEISGKPFYHERSGAWYSMAERDGSLFQRQWRIGPNGKEDHVRELRVDYVMGSGNHVRTYLHRTERGALTELPLAWYAENGGTWAMNPGHDRDYMLAPRSIAYECMSCHNSYPAIPAGHEEPGSEPLYSGELPEGIDCQRCHGPGANHVRAAHSANAKLADVRAAIVNPARLSSDRQVEVCMQCHLETTSLQLPHSLINLGRGPFSYQPGEPLGSFMTFFDHAKGSKYDGDFEIAHSAYRLRKSQCFLRSAGKLACTTCHNPHDVPRGEPAAQHYNGVCRQCHSTLAATHTPSPNCVGCHMPKRRTQDVIHAVMTDHFIQRRPPPREQLLAQIPEREEFDANQYHGEVVPYYPAAPNALYTAVAQVTQRTNLAKGIPRLIAEIEKQKPAGPEVYIELGQAWMSTHKPVNAVAAFQMAVQRKPGSPVALLNLGDALTQSGQPVRAIVLLGRAVKIAPNDALLWYQLGIAQSSAGKEPEAIAAFEKSVALDPDLAEAHNLLGAALGAKGDLTGAGRELRVALQINPDLPDALGNLGHLLAAQGELSQAAFYFARCVRLKPNDGEVRTNYAVTLAGLNQFDEARKQIDAAVKADPKSAEAHNFRGTLLERQSNTTDALKEFLEAARLQPDFGRAQLNAARLLAAKGDKPSAILHLRKAATNSDPNIQRQAAEALRRLSQ
jgi:predicted CXXCH cytochrome family protein